MSDRKVLGEPEGRADRRFLVGPVVMLGGVAPVEQGDTPDHRVLRVPLGHLVFLELVGAVVRMETLVCRGFPGRAPLANLVAVAVVVSGVALDRLVQLERLVGAAQEE